MLYKSEKALRRAFRKQKIEHHSFDIERATDLESRGDERESSVRRNIFAANIH